MKARSVVYPVVALAIAATATLGPAMPAYAVGGNCTSAVEHRSQTGFDAYRVRASCSSLQSDSKARGALDFAAAVDTFTPYFTALNTSYYSDWINAYPGPRGSYTEVRHV